MAITRLTRFLNGKVRGIDLTTQTMTLDNIELKLGTAFNVTFAGAPTANRTITVPDTNVDLGDIATNTASSGANTADIADLRSTTGTADGDVNMGTYTGTVLTDSTTTKANIQELGTQVDTNVTNIGTNVTNIGTNTTDIGNLQSSLGSSAANMGTYTGAVITDNQSAKQNIQQLESYAESTRSLVQNFEFQNSALDLVADNTLVPATEVSGDRYVLSVAGGAPNAAWDGASAGDIVEFDGTNWVALAPTLGMVISIDDETSSLRQWGGAAWDQKFFESTTASTGLAKSGFDIQLADAAENASGIKVLSGVITLEDLGAFTTSDLTENINLYFTDARAIAAPLTGFASGAGVIAGTDTILQGIQKVDGNLAAHISNATGAHAATAISFSNATSGLTATDAQAAIDEVEGRVDTLEAAGGNESVIESMVAGEAMLANTLYCVRIAKAADVGFVSGRVYFAAKETASGDNFHAIGMIYSSVAVAAGDAVSVTKMGKLDTGAIHNLTDGQEHFLGSAGLVIDGGTNGANAPGTINDAVVSMCIARSANIIEVAIERRYVN